MFFILSKVLLFLLVPFCWVTILFIWSLFSKKESTKKRLRIAIVVIFILFTNPFLYRSLVMAWQPAPVELPAGKQYGLGILLGGMSGYDVNNKGFFNSASDRYIQTADLYHRGIIKKILISGGTGSLTQDEPAESFFLRTFFINNGIPDSAIIIESRSRNTSENAIFSKKIIDSLHIQPPYILITSSMHMPRSVGVFRKNGYDCIAYPCNYEVYPSRFSLYNTVVPDAGVMHDWALFLKEMVGTIAYKLTGKA